MSWIKDIIDLLKEREESKKRRLEILELERKEMASKSVIVPATMEDIHRYDTKIREINKKLLVKVGGPLSFLVFATSLLTTVVNHEVYTVFNRPSVKLPSKDSLRESATDGNRSAYVLLATVYDFEKSDEFTRLRHTILREAQDWRVKLGLDERIGRTFLTSDLGQLEIAYDRNFSNRTNRFAIVHAVGWSTNIQAMDRLYFIARVIRDEPDLIVLQEACEAMDRERQSDEDFTRWDSYLRWFEDYESYHLQKIDKRR